MKYAECIRRAKPTQLYTVEKCLFESTFRRFGCFDST